MSGTSRGTVAFFNTPMSLNGTELHHVVSPSSHLWCRHRQLPDHTRLSLSQLAFCWEIQLFWTVRKTSSTFPTVKLSLLDTRHGYCLEIDNVLCGRSFSSFVNGWTRFVSQEKFNYKANLENCYWLLLKIHQIFLLKKRFENINHLGVLSTEKLKIKKYFINSRLLLHFKYGTSMTIWKKSFIRM